MGIGKRRYFRMPVRTQQTGAARGGDPSAYESWGRYPHVTHAGVVPVRSRNALPDLCAIEGSVLPRGYGRSYGDTCLNDGGTLLDVTSLNRIMAFDDGEGLVVCEGGVSLGDILTVALPQGWFLPTTPGTKHVSIGGAIANDVHGKNHHRAGALGRHVRRFELARSDGSRIVCSPSANAEMYAATIGGLGLTGVILWAELQLRRVNGPYMNVEMAPFRSIDEFFDVSADSDAMYEYTMSWVDCLAVGRHLGRGLLMRGNHAWQQSIPGRTAEPRSRFSIPITLPSMLLNGLSVRAFNAVYYRSHSLTTSRSVEPFDRFFYPLDSIGHWNRMYGPAGFVQYQCVVPFASDRTAIRGVLRAISSSNEGSFLAVLKTFGNVTSPGLLSFPRPGVTLALDFAFRGSRTLELLARLDEIVLDGGGAVYPAKDARMSAACFRASFPRWQEFAEHKDPKFSSSFWRRIMEDV